MIGVAVVGYGYWGPNLVRNLAETPGAKLIWVCDLKKDRLAGVQLRYPTVQITDDFDEVLRDPAWTRSRSRRRYRLTTCWL